MGFITVAVMFASDRFPDPVREMKQDSNPLDGEEVGYWKTKDRGKK